MGKNQEKNERARFTLRLDESSYELVKQNYKNDNCESMSEFIEKAILFYVGYVTTENNKSYLPQVVLSTLGSIVTESDNRQNRLLFKLAVEMAMMMNLMALGYDIDRVQLERLRGECVKEVKRTNGSFSLEDAFEWQKG